MRLSPKSVIALSIASIAGVFILVSSLFYNLYMEDFIDHERSNQVQLVQIFDQALTRYFKNLKFLVENAVLHPSFDYKNSKDIDKIRFNKVSFGEALSQYKNDSLVNVLLDEKTDGAIADLKGQEVMNWQLFKGLPEKDPSGNLIAQERRILARNILKAYKELHYVFEMDTNGDLVFLEPYHIQKKISSFNYSFRDYLHLAKQSGQTSLSEGYISHDQERTQIITMATPIFDETNKIVKVFAASVSAVTLRNEVFLELSRELSLSDGSNIYLVDRHGHIVASSNGKDIYFPIDGQEEDINDTGNVRHIGFFKDIEWMPDILEKGNIYERKTMSWRMSSLKKVVSGRYTNLSGQDTYGTFYPTEIIGSKDQKWGILVETPMTTILQAKMKVQLIFLISGIALIAVLITLFSYLMRNFGRLEDSLKKKEDEISDMAAQVAHDIRSPLAALSMALNSYTSTDQEGTQLVRASIKRMKDISTNLLAKTKNQNKAQRDSDEPKGKKDTHPFALYLDSIVSEKQFEYADRENIQINKLFPKESLALSTDIDATEFKRVISNIINNAVESIETYGQVNVELRPKGNMAEIIISDNGCGIKEENICRLTEKNFTFGKQEGTGLGLYHANQTVQQWSGILHINSKEGVGTEVKVILPCVESESYLATQIDLRDIETVVIVDDDESIHQMWISRLNPQQSQFDVLNFYSPVELDQWIQSHSLKLNKTCFLMDYHLGAGLSVGTDLIAKHGIVNSSYLVTSSSTERDLQEKVKSMNLRMIPKELIRHIAIEKSPARVERRPDFPRDFQNH